MNSRFSGTGVALATPMKKDCSTDLNGLRNLVEHTIRGGVDYLVVMGTTGESPTFSWKEKLDLLSYVLDVNNSRLPVVFGLGGNNTSDIVDKLKEIRGFPVQAILSVSPYYNKPSQEGIIRHYSLIADASPLPIILYNVPSRTASNVEATTALTLANHANVIAMKEASGDMEQIREIIQNKPKDFLLLSGDDPSTHEIIKMGSEGVISVVANVVPDTFALMVNKSLRKEKTAAGLNKRLGAAYDLCAKEGNPSSLKAGLQALGICAKTVRPPLFEGSDNLVSAWTNFLQEFRK